MLDHVIFRNKLLDPCLRHGVFTDLGLELTYMDDL
jgi:hypothetical protein